MTPAALEAQQDILGPAQQTVDQSDLALRQSLLIHPHVENLEVDALDLPAIRCAHSGGTPSRLRNVPRLKHYHLHLVTDPLT